MHDAESPYWDQVSLNSTNLNPLYYVYVTGHNYIKDLALVASLVVAVGGCWLAYIQHKYAQSHLQKVMRDLDNLQKSEDALLELQDKWVWNLDSQSCLNCSRNVKNAVC